MTKKTNEIYQIKITLDHARPPIWRRFQVQRSTTLEQLHRIIQVVMGWQDYHLHEFTIDDVAYGDPATDVWGELEIEPEGQHRLTKLVPGEGFRFRYLYDFGDGWEHTLLVEKIAPAEKGARYPVCLKGRRACPPEDVGSLPGYQVFLQAIGDPDHPEHDEYRRWIGRDFDSEAFDLEAVNADLRQLGRGGSVRSIGSVSEDQSGADWQTSVNAWAQELADDLWVQAENLALRRDMIAMLSYLRDNKVTGTQATGNFPLKAVRAICARFVEPPELDTRIGENVYRLRSEDDVWSLVFRHVLASVGGLAEGGPGRRWRLTSLGEQFLTTPAPLQVWLLLATWWAQVNWAIASPFEIQGDYFPPRFQILALDHLLEMPTGESVPYAPFARRLTEEAEFVWPIEDQERAQVILSRIIERSVIDPLIDFGVLKTKQATRKVAGLRLRKLSTFQITPFGSSLLASLKQTPLLD